MLVLDPDSLLLIPGVMAVAFMLWVFWRLSIECRRERRQERERRER